MYYTYLLTITKYLLLSSIIYLASYRTSLLMTDKIWSREEKLKAAETDDLSPESLKRFAKEFMNKIHVRISSKYLATVVPTFFGILEI